MRFSFISVVRGVQPSFVSELLTSAVKFSPELKRSTSVYSDKLSSVFSSAEASTVSSSSKKGISSLFSTSEVSISSATSTSAFSLTDTLSSCAVAPTIAGLATPSIIDAATQQAEYFLLFIFLSFSFQILIFRSSSLEQRFLSPTDRKSGPAFLLLSRIGNILVFWDVMVTCGFSCKKISRTLRMARPSHKIPVPP